MKVKEERKKQRSKRVVGENVSNNAQTSDAASDQSSVPASNSSATGHAPGHVQSARMPTDLSSHSSLASGPLHHIPSAHPTETLYEDNEDEEDEEDELSALPSQSVTSLDQLPWHHQQLYRLYGKKTADDFLYPKFEDKKKTVVTKPINPKLRRQGGEWKLFTRSLVRK